MYNISVVSLTSDGAKPNRRFYNMCQTQELGKKLPYKTVNPFSSCSRELFFFCDVPHLLKTARNCFSNSFAHSKSRNLQVNNLVHHAFLPLWYLHLYVVLPISLYGTYVVPLNSKCYKSFNT